MTPLPVTVTGGNKLLSNQVYSVPIAIHFDLSPQMLVPKSSVQQCSKSILLRIPEAMIVQDE